MDEETPLILVLYDSKPGFTEPDSSPYLLANGDTVNLCHSTAAEQKLLLNALESNERRLTRNYRPDYLPFENQFRLSFILPFHPLNMIAIGSLTGDIGCAVCGDKIKAKCSQCHSISYCGTGTRKLASSSIGKLTQAIQIVSESTGRITRRRVNRCQRVHG